MEMIKIGIAGAAGYTGGELLRLLVNHPSVKILSILSSSHAGKLISSVHCDLLAESSLRFSDSLSEDIDVLFLCMGHGESKKFLADNTLGSNVKIIDLSNDFRLSHQAQFQQRQFIYGLPELNKELIINGANVANPGCFATAILLGLLPLAKELKLNDVYTTGITGSTGAGQMPGATSHFSWRANNIQPYKALTHQHLSEIYQSLHQLQDSFPVLHRSIDSGQMLRNINFVPWRGDFTRGIFISSQLKCTLSLVELYELYEDFYKSDPFTILTTEPLFLKQVINTNNCLIQFDKEGDNLVIHSIIDNLLKGASGQAVQNMNLMFGFQETMGLKLKANYF